MSPEANLSRLSSPGIGLPVSPGGVQSRLFLRIQKDDVLERRGMTERELVSPAELIHAREDLVPGEIGQPLREFIHRAGPSLLQVLKNRLLDGSQVCHVNLPANFQRAGHHPCLRHIGEDEPISRTNRRLNRRMLLIRPRCNGVVQSKVMGDATHGPVKLHSVVQQRCGSVGEKPATPSDTHFLWLRFVPLCTARRVHNRSSTV